MAAALNIPVIKQQVTEVERFFYKKFPRTRKNFRMLHFGCVDTLVLPTPAF